MTAVGNCPDSLAGLASLRPVKLRLYEDKIELASPFLTSLRSHCLLMLLVKNHGPGGKVGYPMHGPKNKLAVVRKEYQSQYESRTSMRIMKAAPRMSYWRPPGDTMA